MERRNNPILVVALVVVIALAIGLAVWQYTRSSQPVDEIPASAYPQPVQGQPTVEEVGPPPDVVPAGTPGSAPTPPPMKGR
jgi:cytochrome oxidase assembly protein ShyY1